MPQHDQVIANAVGSAVRADLNNALAALFSLSSGATAPSTTTPYMWWADTTTNQLKRRNAADSGWVVVATLDEAFALTRSSNTILGQSDRTKTIIVSGGYTQTLTAAATLGDGWAVNFIVDTGVTLVIDPNSTETVDGATTKSITGPAAFSLVCNGTLFRTTADFSAARRSAAVSLSGTSTAFSGIPAGVAVVRMKYADVSLDGTGIPGWQLSDAGGLESTAYAGAGSLVPNASSPVTTNQTAFFPLSGNNTAAAVYHGVAEFRRLEPGSNTWVYTNVGGRSDGAAAVLAAGRKTLSDELSGISYINNGGSSSDAGEMAIEWEF